MLALSTPLWIALFGLQLFALLVVIRFVFSLVASTKALATTVEEAGDRLRVAAGDVHVEAARASERFDDLSGRSIRPLPAKGRRRV